jgi:fumarylacetoacetate (FAA) hydrolase
MKLASLREGGRDGTLVVVSRDLKSAARADGVARTLCDALASWPTAEPALQQTAAALEAARAPGAFSLDLTRLAAPLPRASQWCDGSAYLHHAELVRMARNAPMPAFLYTDPLLYQGASDLFLGPTEDIRLADEAWGIDLEAEVAIVTDDVPMGVTREEAREHIRLVMLVNDVSLRALIPKELEKGFGFFVSKPATTFSPIAVTPDELGAAWDGAKLSLPLESYVNGELLGKPNTGVDLYFDFPQLIAHAATSRDLRAGTIVGSGTVSNRDTAVGSSCLQEKRMREKLEHGEFRTPLLRFGDRVRIDMHGPDNQSIFGAIDQQVTQYIRAAAARQTHATNTSDRKPNDE